MELQISNSSEITLSCTSDTRILTEDIDSLSETISDSLSTELKDEEESTTTCTATITSISVRRVRVVVSLVGKLVLPAVVGVYYAYLRNKQSLVEVLPAVLAFLTNTIAKSLSSVQVAVTNPTTTINPILRVIKLRYRSNAINNANSITSKEDLEDTGGDQEESDEIPESSVTCTILCEPSGGQQPTVDIVFVHGLHGSLVKTWRQGDWKMAKERAESLELKRRASTSCLQNTKPSHQALKRSASTNTTGCPNSKIAKDNFGKRKMCNCQDEFCTCLYEEDDALAEVIEEEPKSECWPRDWLPKDIPDARVIGITYTTDPYLWRPVWIQKRIRTPMETRSIEMTEQLVKLGVGKRPIVWVGHSKGGLFVKQILVDAWERSRNEPIMADLCLQTKAIMFYSVPHRGSSMADFSLPLVRRSVELLEIRKDCDKVLELHKNFLDLINNENFNPEIFSFIETSLTFMAFVYLRIVTFDSADPGVGHTWGVPLDHREICKPKNRSCFLYQELVELVYRTLY